MRFKTLAEWLNWQEGLHPQTIELGLARISQVFQELHPEPPPFTVITVGGTNGKGSTVALLESIFHAAGYQTGACTSPHLLRYNERIRLNSQQASDEQICQAFQRVDEARGETSLTYFEFGTLAALDIFYQNRPDVVLLEVGLGGRLDAVNIIDSDVAVITSIGLDHTDWLGHDRESIAREKAGIMRKERPVICSEQAIPEAIFTEAERTGARLYCLGRDFSYLKIDGHWSWTGPDGDSRVLPMPAQAGEHQLRNAAAAMMVLACLAETLPVSYEQIAQGLSHTPLSGRQQRMQGKANWLLDVAHNEQSIAALADYLKTASPPGRTHAVVGMLGDKDITANLQAISSLVTDWYCVNLDVPRGASAEELEAVLEKLTHTAKVQCFPDVQTAMSAAETMAETGDRLLVFGSFYTVAEALQRGV